MQWALAQRERGQSAPIVLLADLPKGDLDSMVENLKADTRMDIMARTGVPYVCPRHSGPDHTQTTFPLSSLQQRTLQCSRQCCNNSYLS